MNFFIRSKLVLLTTLIAFLFGGGLSLYTVVWLKGDKIEQHQRDARDASFLVSRLLANNLNEVKSGCIATPRTNKFSASYGCVLSIKDVDTLSQDGFGHGKLSPTDTWVTKSNEEVLEVMGPMETSQGKRLGYIKLAYPMAPLHLAIEALVFRNLVIMGICFFLAVLSAIYVATVLTRPLKAVVDASRKIESGNLTAKMPVYDQGEVGELSHSLHGMTNRLVETIRSRDYFDNVIESMVDTLVVADSSGKITTVNEATLALLGYSKNQLVGQSLSLLFFNEEPVFSEPGLPFFKGKRTISDVEREYRHKDGTSIPVLLSCSAFYEDDGAIRGVVCLALDQRERRRAQLELMEAYKERVAAEFANKTKSDFVARVTHELRTPLNAILGYSEMVAEEARDMNLTEIGSDVGKIHRAGAHLLGLINDILDLSKLEAGKVELHAECFSVSELITDTIETVEPLILEQKNELEVICPGEIGEVCSDYQRIKQSLINLLSNSCKFCAKGVIRVTVDSIEDDCIEISVRDTGIGMSEEQMERIWGEFEQADRFTERKYGGTGLGLSISRHFVRALGGQITVQSEEGKWTQFTITLPRYQELKV